MSSIIENYDNITFTLFMNDYMRFIKIFNDMFNFFYYKYFLRITFESMYLLKYKIHMFINFLEIIRFTKNIKKLKSSIKHRERVIY